MNLPRIALLSLSFAAASLPIAAAEAPLVEPIDGAPVIIPRAKQYDLTSRINGRVYRVFVSTPFKAEPGRRYPVFYLLDGNWYFGPASINATESAGAREIQPAIIVGIGYPTDDNDLVGRRRAFELTPSAPATDRSPGEHGGGDVFLRVLDEEIKPFVAAHYPTDPARLILYGKSFGGLAVLRELFRNPTAFSTYIATSPAIGFNHADVLRDEAAFAARARNGEFSVRILITAAGAENRELIRNAEELAARLQPLNPAKVHVEHAILPDETHVSVSLGSLGRALTFALKP